MPPLARLMLIYAAIAAALTESAVAALLIAGGVGLAHGLAWLWG